MTSSPVPSGCWSPCWAASAAGEVVEVLTEFPEPVDVTQQARRTAAEPQDDSLVQGDEREQLSRRRQRNALETQLRHAVETENFEEAARLRDQLRSLPQA